MALSEKARLAILGVVATGAAFLVFRGGSTATSNPLDAVPKDAFLVATVDAADLRRSSLYDVLLGKDAAGTTSALGIGEVASACGFDPLARVTKLAVAVPEGGERGEIGVAAKVEVSKDELERCTKALAEKRGGRARAHEVGSFVLLEDESVSSAARPRLAYGRGGLLLVGRGAWLDAMIGAAERTAPRVSESAAHARLRAGLTEREGWRTPTIVVTALLPSAFRERIKAEMGAEANAADPSSQTMAGVLGVSGVGVALRVGGPGGLIEATVDFECETSDGCAVVDKLIQKKRLEWSKDLALRMVGFGPLVDALVTKQDGARLRATSSANADAIAGAVERAIKLRARRHEPAPRVGVGPTPRPRGERGDERPDEELRAANAANAATATDAGQRGAANAADAADAATR